MCSQSTEVLEKSGNLLAVHISFLGKKRYYRYITNRSVRQATPKRTEKFIIHVTQAVDFQYHQCHFKAHVYSRELDSAGYFFLAI